MTIARLGRILRRREYRRLPNRRLRLLLTIADLAACTPETVGRAIQWGAKPAAVFPARARALREKCAIPLGPLRLPTGPRLYFDIETDVPPRLVWLVGCYVESTGEVRQFLASGPEQEGAMLREFSAFAAGIGDVQWLYFSQSEFDKRILLPRLQQHQIPVAHGLIHSVDVQPRLRAAVAPPAPSFGLKDVAQAFGYRYEHPDLDGLAVAAEYMDCARRGRSIPERLLAYNRDDLLSLQFLVDAVARVCDGGTEERRDPSTAMPPKPG